MTCEACKQAQGYKRLYLDGIILCFPCYEVRLKEEEDRD